MIQVVETMVALPLQYGAAPPPWPRRIRRLLLALALAAIALACWRWGPYAWHQSLLLYWQRQCMNYAMPADTVAYEEEPIAAAGLLKNAEYSPYHLSRGVHGTPVPLVEAASLVPLCWRSLTEKLPTTSFLLVGSVDAKGAPAIIFLHERTSSEGFRRLVCVCYLPEKDDLQPAFFAGYNCYFGVAVPATWTRPLSFVQSEWGFNIQSDRPDRPPLARIYAGQVDPNDPAHFTIRYQMWGQEDVLDGRLQNDDEVTVTPRHPPQLPNN